MLATVVLLWNILRSGTGARELSMRAILAFLLGIMRVVLLGLREGCAEEGLVGGKAADIRWVIELPLAF